MFARVKKSGHYHYLQIVQNRREGTKTIQRVVATIGRMGQLQQKGEISEGQVFYFGVKPFLSRGC